MSLFTIIVPTFNAATTLLAAIESVQTQSESDWELVVVDGASTDATTQLLSQLSESRLTWISEPDSGIYEAMNKGIALATGQWLYFLGADDTLAPDALSTVALAINSTEKLVYGDVVFENGYRMRSFLGPRTWLQNTLHHQSAFYHRSLFADFRYDTSLRLIADYELNLRIYQRGLPTRYVPAVVAYCHSGGASSNLSQSLRETNVVRNRFVHTFWKQAGFSALLWLYYSQKQVRRLLYGHRV